MNPPGFAPVLDEDLDTSTGPNDLETETSSSPPTDPPAGLLRLSHPAASLLAALHSHLLGNPDGADWAADLSRHFSEVRGLVNYNIRVAAAWHRMHGPALVAQLAHLAAGSPTGVVLPVVAGDDLGARLAAFLDALARYGSEELAGSVRRRRHEITALDPVNVIPFLARATRRAA